MRVAIDIANGFSPAERAWFIKSAIEGFARGCLPAFRRWGLPPIFQSGVRFKLPREHGSGLELMRTPLDTYHDGEGDCDRLLVWWLCEQWASGLPASCTAYFLGGNIHVAGRQSWDDRGPVVDPAVICGASVPAGWPPRVPLVRGFQAPLIRGFP